MKTNLGSEFLNVGIKLSIMKGNRDSEFLFDGKS